MWRNTINELWRSLRSVETTILVVAGLVVGGFWLFVLLASEVMEGDTQAIDRRILLALRTPHDLAIPIGPAWLVEVGRDFTALGGVAILTLLVVAVMGALFLLREYDSALLVGASILSGAVLSFLLKQGFNRPRPELVPHLQYVSFASFPSGHSLLSALTYLTLGALVARQTKQRRLKQYILIWALVITFLVGISRVYLGVHWPSDVLAGWTAGAVWALSWWLVAHWFRRRGKDT